MDETNVGKENLQSRLYLWWCLSIAHRRDEVSIAHRGDEVGVFHTYWAICEHAGKPEQFHILTLMVELMCSVDLLVSCFIIHPNPVDLPITYYFSTLYEAFEKLIKNKRTRNDIRR